MASDTLPLATCWYSLVAADALAARREQLFEAVVGATRGVVLDGQLPQLRPADATLGLGLGDLGLGLGQLLVELLDVDLVLVVVLGRARPAAGPAPGSARRSGSASACALCSWSAAAAARRCQRRSDDTRATATGRSQSTEPGDRRVRRPDRAFEYCSRQVTTATCLSIVGPGGARIDTCGPHVRRSGRRRALGGTDGVDVAANGLIPAGSVASVHPIERLRYVARAGWAAPAVLAAEAAWALADLALHEEPAVLPACRRLLDRHPGCGPLWWVAARILTAGDPVPRGRACAPTPSSPIPTATSSRRTSAGDRRAVRHGGVGDVASADIVVVEVDAIGPGGMVVDADDIGLLEAARAVEVPVWVEAGVGRVLPPGSGRLARRVGVDARAWPRPGWWSASRVIDRVAGPLGVQRVAVALAGTDCPEPGELLARW